MADPLVVTDPCCWGSDRPLGASLWQATRQQSTDPSHGLCGGQAGWLYLFSSHHAWLSEEEAGWMLSIAPGPGLKARRELARLSSWCLRATGSPPPSTLLLPTPALRLAPCLSVPSAYGAEVAAACQSVCPCVRRGEIRECQLSKCSVFPRDPCQLGTWPGEGSHLRLVKQRRGRCCLKVLRVRSSSPRLRVMDGWGSRLSGGEGVLVRAWFAFCVNS